MDLVNIGNIGSSLVESECDLCVIEEDPIRNFGCGRDCWRARKVIIRETFKLMKATEGSFLDSLGMIRRKNPYVYEYVPQEIDDESKPINYLNKGESLIIH